LVSSFGELLVGFRRAAGKTQEELAGATGMSVRAISDLERGRRHRPQLRTVEMLAAALGLHGDDAAMFLASARPTVAVGAAGPELFDRDGQLAALRRLAGAARAGRGSVALVSGAAGMGKTALLDVWAGREQAGGMRVARATGGQAEQRFPFAVVRQLLEPLVAKADEMPLLAVGAEPVPPDALQEVLLGLYRLVVRACGDGPLALVVT